MLRAFIVCFIVSLNASYGFRFVGASPLRHFALITRKLFVVVWICISLEWNEKQIVEIFSIMKVHMSASRPYTWNYMIWWSKMCLHPIRYRWPIECARFECLSLTHSFNFASLENRMRLLNLIASFPTCSSLSWLLLLLLFVFFTPFVVLLMMPIMIGAKLKTSSHYKMN